jgi:signal transduction histidine kinase
MHQLTGNLLEMVSIDVDSTDLDLSLFSVQDAIDEIIQSLEKRVLEKNIELVRNYPEHSVEFLGDRTRIKQSVYNILITVLQNTMIHGKIDVIIGVDSENLKIVVKDDSIVIDRNKPARKFFHRSSKVLHFGNGETDGISMPLVKSLIELHGGTLKINSHIGEGTSFVCTLPMKLPKDNVLKMPEPVFSQAVND